MKQSIGIIGLGLLGTAMAERFVELGYPVCGYDLREEACAAAQAVGVEVAPDARAVARGRKHIFLSLMTSENRRELLWGSQGMGESLEPGTVLLDTTTARPGDIVEDHARLAKQGVRLIDVCIAGSSQAARTAAAVALVGDERAAADYHELVAGITKAQFYLGAPGRGNEAKLIVNLVLGLHRLVMSEALGLARKAGFDLEAILEVLKGCPSYSTMMDLKGAQMVQGKYDPPVARLAQHAKDVSLILEYARECGARTPLSEVHAGILRELCDAGYGELDNTAVFEAFRE